MARCECGQQVANMAELEVHVFTDPRHAVKPDTYGSLKSMMRASDDAVLRAKRARQRGKQGETEVVKLWRTAGWTWAARSPGSGSLRPYGSGDVSPWPGDIIGVQPWLVEVKLAQASTAPSREWPGSAFTRKTMHDLLQLSSRHPGSRPVMFMRPPSFRGEPVLWRVVVSALTLKSVIGGTWWADPLEVITLDVPTFFGEVAGQPADALVG